MNSAMSNGEPPVIVIDGRRCRCAALKLRDYKELERRFAAARPDPLACARAQLSEWPEALQRLLLESAFEAALRPSAPTVAELRRWLSGCEGLSAALELSLREECPSVAAEACRRKVYEADGASRAELLRAMERVVGLRFHESDDWGNGPRRIAAARGSATGEADEEPAWVGEPCATD